MILANLVEVVVTRAARGHLRPPRIVPPKWSLQGMSVRSMIRKLLWMMVIGQEIQRRDQWVIQRTLRNNEQRYSLTKTVQGGLVVLSVGLRITPLKIVEGKNM
jgi:hypothetical protein